MSNELTATTRILPPSTDPNDLPIVPYLKLITQTVRANPATVIIGATGSGKTTQVGLHLLRQGLAPDRQRIGVTQPRRIAVTSVAEWVSQLFGCQVGEEVGYQIRFDDATMEGTKLKFMTDGILLQEAAVDPLFSRYDILIFDEAHEQGLNTDIGLGLVKRALQQRPELRVVIMSATIDTGRFSEYFDGAPVISVEGRSYPVEVRYLLEEEHEAAGKMFFEEGESASLPALAAYKARMAHASGGDGHILVFMPGKKEIAQTIEYLNTFNDPTLMPLAAHSEMDKDEQDEIFVETDARKVIVATNIAETSITVADLAYVIDSGLIRQMTFDHKHGIGALKTIEHSKAGLRQRQGRAGRTRPGVYFGLFTEKEYQNGRPQYLEPGQRKRPDYSLPEIKREDLASAVLRMVGLGITDVESFEFMNQPAKGAVANALKSLHALGAISEDNHITTLGAKMATLPVEPRIARMILMAEEFGCVSEILTIAAALSTGTIFTRPIGLETEADAARDKLMDRRGDLFTLLSIVPMYEQKTDRGHWADLHYLNKHVLEEIIKIRDQLHNLITTLNIPISTIDDLRGTTSKVEFGRIKYEAIGKTVTAGLLQSLAIKTSDRDYTRTDGYKMRIHPASVWMDKRPPMIVCTEVLEINGYTYAVDCQAVDYEWLKEIAPHLIQTKKEDLIHPWKGTKVGEYTITTIGGMEVGRRYDGQTLPKHLMNDARRDEVRPNREGRRSQKGKQKHMSRKNKNKGKRRIGKNDRSHYQ
jgi:HrpA-like RNA helicase